MLKRALWTAEDDRSALQNSHLLLVNNVKHCVCMIEIFSCEIFNLFVYNL